MAWIIPCYVQGKIGEGIGESCCLHCIYSLLPYGISWYCLAKLREKYRTQQGISVSSYAAQYIHDTMFCECRVARLAKIVLLLRGHCVL